jgi:hypothetical protein
LLDYRNQLLAVTSESSGGNTKVSETSERRIGGGKNGWSGCGSYSHSFAAS